MIESVEPNPRVAFRVVHEGHGLIVVDKPAGLVTQPGVGHQHDTLLNGLFARYGDRLGALGPQRDFGLVHRLDRGTSGLVAVALDAAAYDALRAAFEARLVRKFYWALTHKAPNQPAGVIRRPIEEVKTRKDRYTSRLHARISPAGRPALTAYRVIHAGDTAALIEARPVTGRLHQVRVHLASVGAGILGDELYGPRRTSHAAPRLALHAWRLVLPPDLDGGSAGPLDLRSPMPRDLRRLLRLHEIEPPSASRRAASAAAALDSAPEAVHEPGGDAVGEDDP